MKLDRIKTSRKLSELSPAQETTIIQMFHDGNGPQSISSKLRIPSGLVGRFLLSKGLRRTRDESKKVKPNCHSEIL